MSTSSILAGKLSGLRTAEKAPATGGLLARALHAIAQAREIQAQREVNRYLARQSDRMLKDIGFDDAGIAELRTKHSI